MFDKGLNTPLVDVSINCSNFLKHFKVSRETYDFEKNYVKKI